MSFLERLCGSFLFSLMLVAGASAGEPDGGAAKAYRADGGGELKGAAQGSPLPATFVAKEGAAFKAADAAVPSGVKSGEPIGALPARLVAGETARFDAAKAGPSVAKTRNGVGSLPTAVGSGEGSVYAAGDGAEPSASKAVEGTGPMGVSKP